MLTPIYPLHMQRDGNYQKLGQMVKIFKIAMYPNIWQDSEVDDIHTTHFICMICDNRNWSRTCLYRENL